MSETQSGDNVESDRNTIGDVTDSVVAQGAGARAYQVGGSLTVHEAPPLPPPPDLIAAEKLYRQQVVTAYNRLRFSGLPGDLFLNEVPLEDIFIRLTLTVEKMVREELPPDERDSGRRGAQPRERVITVQEPVEIAQALRRNVLLIGEPGAGKSTLLSWLAVTFAQGRQAESGRLGAEADPDRLPILIELGRLPRAYLQPENDPPAWRRFLPEYIAGQDAFAGTPPALIAEALAQGRCLLLFDGLDEVAYPQARLRLAGSLADLARLIPGNRLVIGSRPAGVEESSGALHGLFDRCDVARFTSADVQHFFRFWYALDTTLTEDQQAYAVAALFARVQRNPGIMRLATTPLLSTILVILWRNEGRLPERRVDLYARCCRLLVEQWERHHAVSGLARLAGLGWERHLRLLAPLAYIIHNQEQRTSAGRAELVGALADTLVKEKLCQQPKEAQREAEQFLDGLGLRSGLLQHLGGDQFGLPHLTFQEYLTASYLADQCPFEQTVDTLMSHLHESWWREVYLLTVGHLGSHVDKSNRAARLILAVLYRYPPPTFWLRVPRLKRLLLLAPGRYLAQIQFISRLAWLVMREPALADQAWTECISAVIPTSVHEVTVERLRRVQQPPLVLDLAGDSLRQGRIGRQKLAELLATLRDEDRFVREAAAERLGKVEVGNPKVVSALLVALHDVAWSVRGMAARSLGKVGVGDPKVMSALLAALHDEDEFVRRAAAGSLRQVGMKHPEVVTALLTALRDEDVFVRQEAAESLGQLGVGHPEVVVALLTALRDEAQSVREAAAESLGRVGVEHPEVVVPLLTALRDEDIFMRRAVARSLGQVTPTEGKVLRSVLVALHHCVYNPDEDIQQEALGSIRRLLDGRPLPGDRWIPLRARRVRRQALQWTAFLLAVITLLAWSTAVLIPSMETTLAAVLMLLGLVSGLGALGCLVRARVYRDPWEPP